MYADDDKEDENTNRKDLQLKLERFLDHSEFYFHHLPLLKTQLNDIDRLNQPDLYIEKLSKLDFMQFTHIN